MVGSYIHTDIHTCVHTYAHHATLHRTTVHYKSTISCYTNLLTPVCNHTIVHSLIIHSHIHTFVPYMRHIHTYIQTYRHTYRRTNIHMHWRTHTRIDRHALSCMHIYIHTWIHCSRHVRDFFVLMHVSRFPWLRKGLRSKSFEVEWLLDSNSRELEKGPEALRLEGCTGHL